MEYAKRAPAEGKYDYLVLVLICAVATGAIGYVAGQANAPSVQPEQAVPPAYEDWHGNVRRSYEGH